MVAIETPHDSFRRVFTHPLVQGCVVVAAALAVAAAFHTVGRVPDPDTFYHAGMTELAAAREFPRAFPWLDLTVLREQYADLHFLYHLTLVPFVAWLGPMAGIRIATIAFFAIGALAFWIMLRALRVRGALWFTLLLLGGAAFAFRLNLGKAQGLALVVLCLGLAALARRSLIGVLIVALFAGWTSAHWPVLVLAVAAVAGADALTAVMSGAGWRGTFGAIGRGGALLACAAIGIAASFLINPYFPANLAMAQWQIAGIAVVGGIPEATPGGEWSPLPLPDFLRAVGYLLPLAAIALGGTIALVARAALLRKPDTRRAAANALAFGLCTAAFALLTTHARRHVEFLVPLAVAWIAVGTQPIITMLWPPRLVDGWRRPGALRRPFATALLVLATIAFGVGASRAIVAQRTMVADGMSPDYLRATAQWLRTEVPPGEVIFHASWGDFPALFLWDRDHRYLVGLDPRFAYRHDRDRFLAWAAAGRGEAPDGRIAERIVREFGARYAIVTPKQEGLAAALAADPQAREVYADADARVYVLGDQ